MKRHIILIGFKHSGKSAVGKALAQVLGRNFVDLDEEVEKLFCRESGANLAVREIMRQIGEAAFRELESRCLVQILLGAKPLVIALGGGTPMHPAVRDLIKPHTVVLVNAPKGIIFERIMVRGRPAFFPENAEPYQAFCEVLALRQPVYRQLANFTVDNSASISQVVRDLAAQLR